MQHITDLTYDLLIEITPPARTIFKGTAAQLINEGLIPEGFKWPIRQQVATVHIGCFRHEISRCRPQGHKDGSWVKGDYWLLWREPSNQMIGLREQRIHDLKMELADVMYSDTHEWARICDDANKARKNKKYTAFIAGVIGDLAPRKRGRPSKSVTTEQTHAS